MEMEVFMENIELTIIGITCSSCIKPIKDRLKKDKVTIDISVTTGYSYVEFNPKLIKKESIIKAIEDMGYKVEEEN
jgi:copper chaperone CopZ